MIIMFLFTSNICVFVVLFLGKVRNNKVSLCPHVKPSTCLYQRQYRRENFSRRYWRISIISFYTVAIKEPLHWQRTRSIIKGQSISTVDIISIGRNYKMVQWNLSISQQTKMWPTCSQSLWFGPNWNTFQITCAEVMVNHCVNSNDILYFNWYCVGLICYFCIAVCIVLYVVNSFSWVTWV